MKKLAKVAVLTGYRLELECDDHVAGTVDLSDLVGEGVFAVWRDPAVFAQVSIGSAGELLWGELGMDLNVIGGERTLELFQKHRAVAVVFKDRPPVVATAGDVIETTGKQYAQGAAHALLQEKKR